MSPAEVLGHEFDHAQEYNENQEVSINNKSTKVDGYGDKDERVIKDSETKTAQELGRINNDQQTRYDHSGTKYQVPKVSSTADDIQ